MNGRSVHNDIKHLHNRDLVHFDPCFMNETALIPIHLGFILASSWLFNIKFFTMVIVTKEQALCIVYCKSYSKTNVERFSNIIDDLENIEICYYDDPKRPLLQCKRTIYTRPFEIHTKANGDLQMKLIRNKRCKRDKN